MGVHHSLLTPAWHAKLPPTTTPAWHAKLPLLLTAPTPCQVEQKRQHKLFILMKQAGVHHTLLTLAWHAKLPPTTTPAWHAKLPLLLLTAPTPYQVEQSRPQQVNATTSIATSTAMLLLLAVTASASH